ncbi:MAG: hypothetical protein K2H13_10115 [Eubacterium sp.]|nr:hypothetical protein [Eubacterium sp.]MDE6155863.1 hypothetical protein [Eubacterium sp.]
MDKSVINEKLIKSYEVDFGKRKAIVNEYSPNLTNDEIEQNRMTVKNFLVKAFGKNNK